MNLLQIPYSKILDKKKKVGNTIRKHKIFCERKELLDKNIKLLRKKQYYKKLDKIDKTKKSFKLLWEDFRNKKENKRLNLPLSERVLL